MTEPTSANGSKQAEFLIDQCQKLAEIYDARRSDADSQATTVLTADVTLAALIVTAAATLTDTSTAWAVAAMVVLVLSAAIAVWERSGSGLRPLGLGWKEAGRKLFGLDPADKQGPAGRSLLSHETPRFWDAAQELETTEAENCDAAHRATLELWRARVSDVHYIAQAKERSAAASGIMLAVAVILIAVLAVKLVAHHPHPSATSRRVAVTMAARDSTGPVPAVDTGVASRWRLRS